MHQPSLAVVKLTSDIVLDAAELLCQQPVLLGFRSLIVWLCGILGFSDSALHLCTVNLG